MKGFFICLPLYVHYLLLHFKLTLPQILSAQFQSPHLLSVVEVALQLFSLSPRFEADGDTSALKSHALWPGFCS